MKKLIIIVTTACLICSSIMPVYASKNIPINILVNDKSVEFNSEGGSPFIDNNSRTQVPFRATLEALGAQVIWDKGRQTAIAIKDDIIIEIPIGKPYIIKNGVTISADTSSLVKDGRTYLPIRPVIEALGADINWNSSTGTVRITNTEPVSESKNKYSFGSISTNEYDYAGYLNNNIPDINGSFTYKNGSTYQGGISNGLFAGTGRFVFKNGDEYTGNFDNGLRDGHGIYNASKIAYIEGTWDKGELKGNATVLYLDRSKYVGNMENGVRSGAGTFTFTNGDYYTGNWANDEYNGQGIYYFNNGSYYSGTWENGMLNGTAIYQKSTYLKYECTFDEGKLVDCNAVY